MDDVSSKQSRRLLTWGRCLIYALLAVILTCGGLYGLVYLTFNWQYIRGNYVASQAQSRVEKIYAQVRKNTPNGVTLLSEEIPQSFTYAWGLSDGSPRYARVQARQIYTTSLAFSDVSTMYENEFKKWGWVSLPVDSEAAAIHTAFAHSDDKATIVGLCSPLDDPAQFIVFFEYDETTGPNCEGHQTRLGCLAARYCR